MLRLDPPWHRNPDGSVWAYERDLMADAVVTVTLYKPLRHRVLAWIGKALVCAGFLLLGPKRIKFNLEPEAPADDAR